MQLIDESFFIGEIVVAQTDQVEVSENLQVFIKKYQREFLTLLLGQTVYDQFIAELIKPDADIAQKWKDLYNKLIFVDGLYKGSPIANYVYYFYMRNNVTQTTGIGEGKGKAENATIGINNDKMVRAWNEMSEYSKITIEWFRNFYKANYFTGYYYQGYFRHECEDLLAIKNTLNL